MNNFYSCFHKCTTGYISIYKDKKSEQNPWKSNTLEWTTPVEHIHGIWPGELPTVPRWAYDYSKSGHDDDFVSQSGALEEV